MKLKFKIQSYQTDAVDAVVNCFQGQPPSTGVTYRIDPGNVEANSQMTVDYAEAGFRNADVALDHGRLLGNIQEIQREQNLPVSASLSSSKVCPINLDIEMETGTGKTYCYIKTMFEMNKRYGWSKFIVVVPSVAIREGVHKSFQITAEHFLEQYGKRARYFIYNSKSLHDLESYSSDAGINVMIINVQAFNARGKDARRIYEELDDFQSRRPIDVIKRNHPILIIDEPQKIEGATGKASKSFDSLVEFHPLMILRYSATHRKEHNKVYRLDALDAYNQKLVKKIDVRGISIKGMSGTHAYLYLESIQISASKPPVARIEFEKKTASGAIKRVVQKVERKDNLHVLSGELDEYRDRFVVTEIDARRNVVEFENGLILEAGEATGDVNESSLRRIQIRETIRAHLEKEEILYEQGIKVLSLFFIDEVSKYRVYQDGEPQSGEYAEVFEEEYTAALNEWITLYDTPFTRYLKNIPVRKTHNGYFSIDKQKHMVNPNASTRGENAGETDDADAYDLILRDKERLLSLDEPVRFIFSHSALREGWDNPNVFVICTLKHSDNTITRRQEVGRGLRIAVNQQGDRIDNPLTVHSTNILTVVANESYQDFVSGLQSDIKAAIAARPQRADENYFNGKILHTESGKVTVDSQMAKSIYRYLIKHDFTDDHDQITQAYQDAKRAGALPILPDALVPYREQVFQLIDAVYSDASMPEIADNRKGQRNNLNPNFEKQEFKELWNRINRQASYSVHFDSNELVEKCIRGLNSNLRVAPLQYAIQRGDQKATLTYEDVKQGDQFVLRESSSGRIDSSVHSSVKYDLIGKLSEGCQLKRSTIASILKGLEKPVFFQFRTNPEDFIAKAVQFINEQKATMIVEHLVYNPTDQTHTMDIFTCDKGKQDFSKAFKAQRHIFDYVFTDSETERKFVTELDTCEEVVVYSKLPKGFSIPTPVGNYNPDWAISFKERSVKHVYFVAETKGSMSSMELREIEKSKIACAKKFFSKITSDEVKYDVVNSYGKLMELVG